MRLLGNCIVWMRVTVSNLMSEDVFASIRRRLSTMTNLGDDQPILNGEFGECYTGIDHRIDLNEWEELITKLLSS